LILKLIACEILFRELCAAVARSPHRVDIEFLPKGLHDIGKVGMQARLQEAIDAVDQTRYDAILLGYAVTAWWASRRGEVRWSCRGPMIASPCSWATSSVT
jgi:hypothetical protein